MRGKNKSSAYLVSPVTLPSASTLGNGLPMMANSLSLIARCGGLDPHPFRGQLDGLQNLGVACAPAQIPRQGFTDSVAGRVRVVIEHGFGRDEDAGRAVAALGRAQLGERSLQGVRPPLLGQPLDRQNLPILD